MDREETGNKRIRSYIPQEIIENHLLCRLPVKSLLRFRCVSKSWRCLIDSKRFINAHLQNSKRNNTACIIIPECQPHSDGLTVGVCNGLLCIRRSGDFFLVNPATKISRKLPSITRLLGFRGQQFEKCGFGWDESSGAYKVFAVFADVNARVTCQIYSSITNSWRMIEYRLLCAHTEVGIGKFICGNIHWLMGQNNVIEFLDLKREVFGMIKPPRRVMRGMQRLGETQGCLSLVKFSDCKAMLIIDVWVMKEYGVNESWVRVATVKPCFGMVYDVHEKVLSLPRKLGYWSYAGCAYVESLVAPPGEDDRS